MRMPPPVAPSGDPDERNYKSPKFSLGTLTTITIYHDYLCPWCWAGWIHAVRLKQEFGVTFDWRGAELIPPGMAYEPGPPTPVDPNAPPKPPSRFDLFLQSEGIELPTPRPSFVRTHSALLGAEYARTQGPEMADAYHEAIYRAYWERREDIADLAVLARLGAGIGLDPDALRASIVSEEFDEMILPYDDDAYANGIRHVPSFIFNGEELVAEAPYSTLAAATERFLVRAAKFKKE
ncbi:MAG: DsbA family protein [Capsulimonadales bacterium]|nr:DsbA family protein [Capsulimonadales bacterium]